MGWGGAFFFNPVKTRLWIGLEKEGLAHPVEKAVISMDGEPVLPGTEPGEVHGHPVEIPGEYLFRPVLSIEADFHLDNALIRSQRKDHSSVFDLITIIGKGRCGHFLDRVPAGGRPDPGEILPYLIHLFPAHADG